VVIVFSDHAQWSADRGSMLLDATVGGTRVPCVVSMEFLMLNETIPEAADLKAAITERACLVFTRDRDRIHELLRDRIRHGAYTAAGEVILG
jgi:hypothetical protein